MRAARSYTSVRFALFLVAALGLGRIADAQAYAAADLGAQVWSSIAPLPGVVHLVAIEACDDCDEPVTLPFAFQWFGRSITNVQVTSNGQISMDGRTGAFCCGTVPIPAADTNNDAIFFCKEDIDPAGVGSVQHLTQGVPGSRTWTLEYTNVSFFPGPATGLANVQVILYENPPGQIDIIWGPGNSAANSISAGVEDIGGLDGAAAISGGFFGPTGISAVWPANTGCRFVPPCAGSCLAPLPLVPTVMGPTRARTSADMITVDTTLCGTNDHTSSCPRAGGTDGDDAAVTFTAPFGGSCTASTCGSVTTFDTILTALDGTCGGMEIACNDDQGCGSGLSEVSFSIQQGSRYTIIVDGYNGATGVVDLFVDLTEQQRILNFHDDPGINYMTSVATAIGASLTVTTTSAAFDAAYDSGGWDAIVYDSYAGSPTMGNLDRLDEYARFGQRLLVNIADMATAATHPLFTTTAPINYISSYSTPESLIDWAPGHPVWTTPGLVTPTPIAPSGYDAFAIDGHRADPAGASIALGGFVTPTSTPGNAGVILNGRGNVIVNLFTPETLAMTPTVQLLINELALDVVTCSSGAGNDLVVTGPTTINTDTGIVSPPGGVSAAWDGTTFNFDNIDVRIGQTLTVSGAAPLVLLATGTVLVDGTILASGTAGGDAPVLCNFDSGPAGAGGPGGFAGGTGGGNSIPLLGGNGQDGAGPGGGGGGDTRTTAAGANESGGGGGGGHALAGTAGASLGAAIGGAAGSDYPSAPPIIGGSGGGGGSIDDDNGTLSDPPTTNDDGGGGGGGGGGAVRIVAEAALSVNGSILVRGGNGGEGDGCGGAGGGGGAGGTVELFAVPLPVVTGLLDVAGGTGGLGNGGAVGGAGSAGRMRTDLSSCVPVPGCAVALPGGAGPYSGNVAFDLTLQSVSAGAVTLTVEFSTDSGSSWLLCTPALGSPVPTNPAMGVPTGMASFLWASRADGVALTMLVPGMLVRARINDGVSFADGTCVSMPFSVDNQALCGGICGDCNENMMGPDILDALTAAQISAGLIVPTAGQIACCDTNSSMAVEILDALTIAQSAAGLGVALMCL